MFLDSFDVEAPGHKTALDTPIAVSRIDVALILIMAALAGYFFIYPLWRSQFFIEIWFTEGWNAYFQDAAASGGRVYPSGPRWGRCGTQRSCRTTSPPM